MERRRGGISEELERGASAWRGGISEEPDECEDGANNRHVNEQT